MLIEKLPFVAPKLTAVAHLREGDTFSERLERAIAVAATPSTQSRWRCLRQKSMQAQMFSREFADVC